MHTLGIYQVRFILYINFYIFMGKDFRCHHGHLWIHSRFSKNQKISKLATRMRFRIQNIKPDDITLRFWTLKIKVKDNRVSCELCIFQTRNSLFSKCKTWSVCITSVNMAESKLSYYNSDETRESTDNYLERFNIYCDIEEYKAERRQQILLTSTSPELYARLKEQVHHKEISKLNFSELKQLLRHRISNVTTERYTFHSLTQ